MRCVAASEVGKRVVSVSDDTTPSVWDLKSGELVDKPLQGQNGQAW